MPVNSVTGWELNRYTPTPKFAKAIIEFLGYFPFSGSNQTLGKQLYYARLITGKNQKEVADEIGCDESNLRYIELDQRVPQAKIKEKIRDFIDAALGTLHQNDDSGGPNSLA